MVESQATKFKIELSMYGVVEVLKWCIDRNNGRIPGTDTTVFKEMQAALKEKPVKGDYFTYDQFWKTTKVYEFTREEVETVDQCLYDIPNMEGRQNPAVRYKFWAVQADWHE
jgi:hypothetical protein